MDTDNKNSWDWIIVNPKKWANKWANKDSRCLHDNCSSCDGTGIRKDGLGPCVHMMSCSCPKCSPCRM